MDGARKIDGLEVLTRTEQTHDATELLKPGTRQTFWSNTDEHAADGFWPEGSVGLEQSGQGVTFKPSELHRLKNAFAQNAPEGEASHADLDELDARIAETFQQLRAAPRGSPEREQLANQLDALKSAKQALQDELDDVANWSV